MHRIPTATEIYIICFPDGSLTGFVYNPAEHTNLGRAWPDSRTLWLCRVWISLPRRRTPVRIETEALSAGKTIVLNLTT